jgi:hypothetical protein
MTREVVYQALFDFLKTAAVFQTTGRKPTAWSQVPPEAQPALFVAEDSEEATTKVVAMPYRWSLMAKCWVYAHSNDDAIAPGTLMNPLLDAITNLMTPATPGERITLKGLVYHVQFKGPWLRDGGMFGPQAVAIIPIEMLLGYQV